DSLRRADGRASTATVGAGAGGVRADADYALPAEQNPAVAESGFADRGRSALVDRAADTRVAGCVPGSGEGRADRDTCSGGRSRAGRDVRRPGSRAERCGTDGARALGSGSLLRADEA